MGQRILVVEDNPLNMQLVSDLLSLYGYEVLQATTGAYALVIAEEQRPDLILMDVALRGMHGLEITRLLKQNPNTARIPVVALTAYAAEPDRKRALQAGCIGFVAKPIDTRALPGIVAHYLKEVASGEPTHTPPASDRGR